ncbi:cysteine proteinases superfamily protein [Actinidia rufa]|uniref:Cysteine proteinases superfamily protein n=1 Tax=Actinidia rufa TaxID=165716 RepID=A0A7J0EFK0_9ERIC|nr:cysteine proteinases superfamily protein [Actinidia rufa]
MNDQPSETATIVIMAMDENDVLLATSADGKSDWVLNLDSVYHLCRDREVFSIYAACEELIRVVNNTVNRVVGKGTVQFRIGNERLVTLTERNSENLQEKQGDAVGKEDWKAIPILGECADMRSYCSTWVHWSAGKYFETCTKVWLDTSGATSAGCPERSLEEGDKDDFEKLYSDGRDVAETRRSYKLVPCYIMINGTQNVGECSSSTSLSSQQDVYDDRMIAVVLSEEYAKLDGAVGRRLSNLAPVPHVPRINSFIPNVNDASLDHQRLLQRLNVYGLYEMKVSGDGNCQFRALSDQMYKSPEYHKHVRKEVVKQVVIKSVGQMTLLNDLNMVGHLKQYHSTCTEQNLLWNTVSTFPAATASSAVSYISPSAVPNVPQLPHWSPVTANFLPQIGDLKDCRSLYEGYVPMKYKRYYKKMAKSGEWGDHVTLQAAADKV